MQSYLLEYAVDWLTKSLFFVIQITFFAILAENLSVEEFCKLAKAYEGSILSK